MFTDDVLFQDRDCPPEGFCSFDSVPKLCTWENEESNYRFLFKYLNLTQCFLSELDALDWEIGNAITAGLSIGDHTFSTALGYFLYLDTNNARPGEEVRTKQNRKVS